MKEELMRLLMQEGVVAVGRDNDGIVIYVKNGFVPESIPKGAKVKSIGEFKGYFTTLGRVRPLVSGVSVAHYKGTAGTLGGVAKSIDGIVGIGCNHVLAMNWGNISIGRVGDPILQPGPYDGGRYPRDFVGMLRNWSKVDVNEPSIVDGASFYITVPTETVIPEIGPVYGVAEPKPGMQVKKFGRTSLLTYSEIEAVDVIAKVRQWGTVIFEDQILIKQPFAFEGDSGSLIMDDYNRVVGMVSAGNSRYVLASKAGNIERELGIRIVGVNGNV